MSQATSAWFVIAIAFLAANLPFFTQRLAGLLSLSGGKTAWVRVLELVVMYFLVGGIGLALEQRAGQIAPQNWEFYATTAALFVTFAFPGFVYRYLLKHSD